MSNFYLCLWQVSVTKFKLSFLIQWILPNGWSSKTLPGSTAAAALSAVSLPPPPTTTVWTWTPTAVNPTLTAGRSARGSSLDAWSSTGKKDDWMSAVESSVNADQVRLREVAYQLGSTFLALLNTYPYITLAPRSICFANYFRKKGSFGRGGHKKR